MNGTEIDRMIVRLLGDGTSHTAMWHAAVATAEASAKAVVAAARTVKAGVAGVMLPVIGPVMSGISDIFGDVSGAIVGMLNPLNWVRGAFSLLGSGVSLVLSPFTMLFSILSSTVGQMLAMTLATVSLAGAFQAAKWGVQLAAEAEMTEAVFERMLGSVDKAKKMMADIEKFAAVTPMDTASLQASAKMLMQLGNVAEHNVLPTLKMLGDVTGGDANRFKSMTLAFSQMRTAGRLMGQDLLQMINAGFNPLSIMAQTTGKDISVLKKEMERGRITTRMVEQAFIDATKEGGKFGGMMDRQSATLLGKWSTLMDNISITMKEIGQQLIERFNFKGLLQRAIEFTDQFRNNFKANFDIALAWATKWFNYFYGHGRQQFVRLSETVRMVWGQLMTWLDANAPQFGADELQKGFNQAGETVRSFASQALGFLFNFGTNSKAVWTFVAENAVIIFNWLSDQWRLLVNGWPTALSVAGETALRVFGQFGYGLIRAAEYTIGFLFGKFSDFMERQFPHLIQTGLKASVQLFSVWSQGITGLVASTLAGDQSGITAALGDLSDHLGKDFFEGAEAMGVDEYFAGLGKIAATTGQEMANELSAPLKKGFDGLMKGIPDLKEMGPLETDLTLFDLPPWQWEAAKEAGLQVGEAFAEGSGSISAKVGKELKQVDAIAFNSVEALSRIADFQTTLPDHLRGDMKVTQQSEKDKLNERMANGIDQLVELQQLRLGRENAVTINPANIA